MIFESFWPLALLASVPVVIILYLLRPKGKDYRNSSNLLWERMLKNQQSKTFVEKFIHNLLMYLQIAILLLMVLALMSPYLHRAGVSRGNVVLVFDTSGSMQHDAGSGKSRLGEAVAEAKRMITDSDESSFSIVASGCDTELLAVGVKDKGSLYAALEELVCCDGRGDLKDAESVVDTLANAAEAGETSVVVFTDGDGAEAAMSFSDYFGAEIRVIGEAVSNVSNNFLSYVEDEEGILVAASLTNYSDVQAQLEIGLYEGARLIQLKSVTLAAGETSLCYFSRFDWDGEPLKSEISSVRFAGSGEKDSLAADNAAYVVRENADRMEAVLIGSGNTYLEKAYLAVSGNSLAKAESESAAQPDAVRIYDAGYEAAEPVSRMVFADDERAAGEKENVMLLAEDCDLTAGLGAFPIGVNRTKIYELPEWGIPFLWAGEDCAGYYGEKDGVKLVAVGFDLRESDFALKAEFPVFMSNALGFLGDTSLLAANVYEAGQKVIFHPQADFDVGTLAADTSKAGLYEVGDGERTEWYVVRFAAAGESDGQKRAEGTEGAQTAAGVLAKRQLRNLLIVLVLLALVLEWIIYLRQTRSRVRFYLGVRVMLVVFLLLALCNVAISKRQSDNTTIFLVDISNSNAQNLGKMEEDVSAALKQMPKKNRYGIVTFGKNSLVEQFLTGENHFAGIMSLPDKTATNYEEAISRALAMIPADGGGRIVTLTDGRETRGAIAGTAPALVSRNIEFLAKVYETAGGDDAYIENVELPSYLYQGDAYTMTVTVMSNYETDATLSVWMGTIQTDAYAVHLNRGANRFRFQQKVRGESVESFEVRVDAAGDSCAENDRYHAYSVVDAAPKVLLVSGMDEDSANFEALLDAANVNYRTVSALNAPDSLEEMLEYRSVILENVYLTDLPDGFLENVETYVKDYACGLVCCGGEDSFALGGYRDSVLETVLPVNMQLRGVNEVPSMAMIMVIDHSGSMSMDLGSGATNLDLAITAAEHAVDQLRASDYVGVLTFDDQYSWVVRPTLCKDKKAIKQQIETVAEGGGTTIKPALWEALKGVKACDVGIRHVVLLTDGQGETQYYGDVSDAYRKAQVTLSTVAVGEDSDSALLEQLARACNGRYYYSDMAEEIPRIFAQEVFLSGDTYLQNGSFALAVNGGHEITRGLFENGWPKISGYVSASPKNSAAQLIASEKDDPLLTVMQYGLGHTVAWNTDVTNTWTAAFAGQEDYVALWKRVIDYSAGNAGIGEDSVDVFTAGGLTSISYRALGYGENTRVEAVYTDPDGKTQTAELTATAPGRFETKLDTDMTGVYALSVRRIDDGEISNAVTTAAVVQYSDEYKFGVGTTAFLTFAARYGRLLEDGENFWQERKSGVRERYELAKWLLLLAILWFVMDIALRRFCFLPQDTRAYRALRKRWEERRAVRGYPAGRGARGKMAADGAAVSGANLSMGSKDSGEGSGSAYEGLADRKRAVDSGIRDSGEGMEVSGGAGVAAASADGSAAKRAKKSGKAKRKDAGRNAPQTLDTSALLKKKDSRDGGVS